MQKGYELCGSPVSDRSAIKTIEAAGWPADLPQSTYILLQDAAFRYGAAAALSFFLSAERHAKVRCWSYAQLFTEVTRAANIFHDLGIGPGDSVAYMLPNLPETHFVLWGAEAAGTAVAINPLLEADAIGALLAASGASILVTLAPFPGSDLYEKAVAALANAPDLRHLVLVDPARHTDGWRRIGARLLGGKAARAASPVPRPVVVHDFFRLAARTRGDRLTSGRAISSDDISSCFCTGGTTGLPKLARRTHGSEVANAWMSAQAIGDAMAPGTVIFCGLPLFHVNAAMVTGLAAFISGAHVLLGTPQGYRGPGVVDSFWSIVEHHRVAVFSGVPTLFASLLTKSTVGRDLASLKFAFCGAAPMPADLISRFEAATGIAIVEGYGLTEGTCVSALNPLGGERKPGSIGLSIPFQELDVLVFDADGRFVREAATDEVGRIAISGRNVFAGYLSNAHNRNIWIDRGDGRRWFDTGDLGRKDASGYVWLTGRAKDIIIRAGHNIDPVVIEDALQSHPAVALAAAVGRPDAYAGELPVAYVQLHAGAAATEAALLQHAERLVSERAAWPKAIHIVDALPLTAIGKTFKPALKDREAERVPEDIIGKLGTSGSVSTRRGADQAPITIVRVPADKRDAVAAMLADFSFKSQVESAE